MCEITEVDIRMLRIGVNGTSYFVKIGQARTEFYASKYFFLHRRKEALKKGH
jgi:hypothetical protein